MRSRNISTVPSSFGTTASNARLGGVVGVTEELGDAELLDDLAVDVETIVVGGVALARRLGSLALRPHLGVEAGDVDGDVALAGDLFGELEREPVRVVKQERGRPGQLGAIAAQLVFEDRQTVLQRLAEPLFLAGQDADDEVAVLGDVGVGVAHDVDRGLDERRHHQLLGAEQVGVAHGSTDDAPQHVAAALVGREHAVADEHGAAAGVLGEHAHGEGVAIVVVAGRVGLAGEAARLIDQREHQVGLPHGVDALQQAEHALEPEAGVDRRLRQQRAAAIGRLVVLHEDQVPELHVAVAVRVAERATVGAERRTAVDVDLAARPARAGVAHLPEVVLVAEALDALHRYADLLVPDRLGLVVALVDGDPQTVAVEAERLGRQLPAPRDDLVLEVVTEAEVAEHLEEHQVALGAPDVVEVVVLAAGSGALLAADRALVRRHFVADEVRLERHHAGDGEQHRRIVRDQAGRRHHRMSSCSEEVEEGVAQLVGVLWWCSHGVASLPR